jgi:very-short-patch-repair endonuclease
VRGETLSNQHARGLRKSLTDAERVLWHNLRDRRLGGWNFRRQHVIGPFIVNFICVEKKLIVEVDGGQHAEMIIQDHNRTEYLNKNGYRVMRFWNNEVLQETEAVLQVLFSTLSADTPSP